LVTPLNQPGYSRLSYSDDVADPYTCPLCGQHGLIRIRRRFIDRILSLFVRQRRFRCTQPGCQWQGNLREKTAAGSPGGRR